MYPINPNPMLEALTGGWMPLVQIAGGEGMACVFTSHGKAEDYKNSYDQQAMGQIRKYEITAMSADEVKNLNLLSDKITIVAVDPTLVYGQFSVGKVIPIYEFS